MALHSAFKFTFYSTILATFGWKWNHIIYISYTSFSMSLGKAWLAWKAFSMCTLNFATFIAGHFMKM